MVVQDKKLAISRDKFDTVTYKNHEYLTRDLYYRDMFGENHFYVIADDTLAKNIFNDDGSYVDSEIEAIDCKIYCYAPISALLIEDDIELAWWLENNITEMELE